MLFFFFQAEDGIRDLVRSRGLGDVYKRQTLATIMSRASVSMAPSEYLWSVGSVVKVPPATQLLEPSFFSQDADSHVSPSGSLS